MEPMSIEEVRALLGKTGVTVSEERLKALAETMTDYRPKVDSLYDVDVDDVEAAGSFPSRMDGRIGGTSSKESGHSIRTYSKEL